MSKLFGLYSWPRVCLTSISLFILLSCCHFAVMPSYCSPSLSLAPCFWAEQSWDFLRYSSIHASLRGALWGVFCLGIHESFNRFCNLSCCVYLEKSCNKAIATILVDISCYALALVWSCTISINVLKDAVYKGFCVIVAVAAGVWLRFNLKNFFLSLSAAFYTKLSYRLPLRDHCLLLCVL